MTVKSKPFANAPSHAIKASRQHRVALISFREDYVECVDGWSGSISDAEAHGFTISRARNEASFAGASGKVPNSRVITAVFP